MHPLLKVAVTQPNLLVAHAEGYAELIVAEAATAAGRWRWRVALHAAALCAWSVTAVLTGVALMLWSVLPETHLLVLWPLIIVPLVPLVIAVGCNVAARPPQDEMAFADVRRQLAADLAMLREVGT